MRGAGGWWITAAAVGCCVLTGSGDGSFTGPTHFSGPVGLCTGMVAADFDDRNGEDLALACGGAPAGKPAPDPVVGQRTINVLV